MISLVNVLSDDGLKDTDLLRSLRFLLIDNLVSKIETH